MRYRDDIKLFWRTDLRLFCGRFVKYMGGQKNKGQYTCREALTDKNDFKSYKINLLQIEELWMTMWNVSLETNHASWKKWLIQCQDHIQKQTGTFTICVDRKKINPSYLWGYEDKPTKEQSRLSEQHDFVNATKATIEKFGQIHYFLVSFHLFR